MACLCYVRQRTDTRQFHETFVRRLFGSEGCHKETRGGQCIHVASHCRTGHSLYSFRYLCIYVTPEIFYNPGHRRRHKIFRILATGRCHYIDSHGSDYRYYYISIGQREECEDNRAVYRGRDLTG